MGAIEEAGGATVPVIESGHTMAEDTELWARLGVQIEIVTGYDTQITTTEAEIQAATDRLSALEEARDAAQRSRDELQAEVDRRGDRAGLVDRTTETTA